MNCQKGFFQNKLFLFNKVLFLVTSAILLIAISRLFLLRWETVFLLPDAVKDEVGFVEDFNIYLAKGWYNSVATGTSPLFNLAGRFFYSFTANPLMSLRLVSFTSFLTLIVIWCYFLYNDLAVKGPVFFISVLFLINVGLVRGAYFSGCDDPLFITFVSLAFICLYRSVQVKTATIKQLLLAGAFYGASLSVRPLFIYYLPGVLLLLILVYLFNCDYRKYLVLFFVSFFVTVVVVQYPSLKEKKLLSVHNKDFSEKGVTWAEINYLALLRNKQHLLFGRNNKLKPTTDEVLLYKGRHGKSSLPETYFQSLLRNPTITIQNFIGLIYLHALPFVRQLAFFYLFFLLVVLNAFFKKQLCSSQLIYAFLFYLSFTVFLCITPVVHLEFRWFMAFTFLITVFAIHELYRKSEKAELFKTVIYFNMLFIGILNALLIGIW